jgi:hypothetical protein
LNLQARAGIGLAMPGNWFCGDLHSSRWLRHIKSSRWIDVKISRGPDQLSAGWLAC